MSFVLLLTKSKTTSLISSSMTSFKFMVRLERIISSTEYRLVHCYVCLWSSLTCGFSSFGLVAEVSGLYRWRSHSLCEYVFLAINVSFIRRAYEFDV
ncbi:hypothetical protein NC651_030536 [Populus alba x Populus x berolinensis]|nr:hypothetical protein NC651_030536 [Populus alba x Populus x berolinensis]